MSHRFEEIMLKINTVHCGDCLELMQDIPDGSVDMVMADPPYGTTACKWDSIIPLADMWKQLKRVIKPNGAVVMTASQPFTTKLISSNMEWFKYEWIWEKHQGTGHLNANKQPLREHENIIIFYKSQSVYNGQMEGSKKRTVRRSGNLSKTENYGKFTEVSISKYIGRYPGSILRFDKSNDIVHPTQKPVALMSYLIKTYTNEGDTVLDFCCGSGTTGVACKRWNREYILIEKEAEYCDIARRRLEAEDNLFSEAENR